MFIVTLTFSDNKAQAKDAMSGHNAWIKQGFDEGIFMLVGGMEPGLGGALIAHNTTREALEQRVSEDPFVELNIVTAEIIEITPKKADERLSFLLK